MTTHIVPERTIMYHIKFKLLFNNIFTLLLLVICISVMHSNKVQAIGIADYSYDKIYKTLQAKYRNTNYIYKDSDDVCLITFATYNGSDYRTSIKKKSNSNELLYCIDHNDKIEFRDQYELHDTFFNLELRTRLAILFYHSPSIWGEKSNSEFSTGNFVLDYYMTQVVTHALIYRYGDDKSNMGINLDKLVYKEQTAKLQKKIKQLYAFCCNAKVQYHNGEFQTADFAFQKIEDTNFYFDTTHFVSSTITCKEFPNNADVRNYNRVIDGENILMKETIINTQNNCYNSDIQLSIPRSVIEDLSPDRYHITLYEQVNFDVMYAGLWQCDAVDYTGTTQELGGPLIQTIEADDIVTFDLLVGKLYLYKTDSVTLENILDAKFEVQQYNSETKQYEFYCDMVYDSDQKRFESRNLYLATTNKEGKFKVIETTSGKNYQLDWDGQCFEVNKDEYIHEIYVENEPILGKLILHKRGEQWSLKEDGFFNNDIVSLPNVKFELYAKEDIYVKNRVKFTKNQKILDMITDSNGNSVVEGLPMGTYYVKETESLKDYVLDSQVIDFTITRDENRQYKEIELSFFNKLKKSQIQIFKCYYDEKDTKEEKPIPLPGAQFGLYIKEDLCDIYGNVIVKKDTCIARKESDSNGNVLFNNLPYVEYYVKELEAPKDFVLNDGIISLQLDDFQYNETTDMYECKKEIINKKQRFQLTVVKSGEYFIDSLKKTSTYGDFYSYVIGEQRLKGSTFSLFNEKKELVNTQTTDENGNVFFCDLLPGIYHLIETKAPTQYKLLEIEEDIDIHMDSKLYNELTVQEISKSFLNELSECSLQLRKYGESFYVKDKKLKYKNIPLEGVIYGIYQNFDYVFANPSKNNQKLDKGSCVGYIVTNNEGIGTFKGKLPCGSYYIKELYTVNGYELDVEKYYFEIQPNNNQTIQVKINNDNNTFYNTLSKAAVKIVKIDSDSEKPLKNVEFTLYNEKNQQIGVYQTNKRGEIFVEQLPYGKYYFIETKCRDGYYSTNNKFNFELNNKETVVLNITNSPILKLGFNEHYKTALLVTGIIAIIFFLMGVISYHKRKYQKHNEA